MIDTIVGLIRTSIICMDINLLLYISIDSRIRSTADPPCFIQRRKCLVVLPPNIVPAIALSTAISHAQGDENQPPRLELLVEKVWTVDVFVCLYTHMCMELCVELMLGMSA